MTSHHSDRVIRSWAKRHKILVKDAGFVPHALREAYTAWRRLEDLKRKR